MFKPIEHRTTTLFIQSAQAMVKTTSGYKELDLYQRESTGHVYAKNGSFYISLMCGGITSNSKITWVELDGIEEIYDTSYLKYEFVEKKE